MSLRIQSGSAGGRRLKSPPKGAEVRPILARIRKSLFDILRPRLSGAAFLDLYAGTGTVGLEALSNGARRAVFLDMDGRCCRVIEENAARLGVSDKVEVHRSDATKSLAWLGRGTFDIVFLGPPYKDEAKRPLALTVPTLARVAEAGLLAPSGWVIGQRQEKEPLAGLAPAWELFREKEYGDTTLAFFRLKQAAAE